MWVPLKNEQICTDSRGVNGKSTQGRFFEDFSLGETIQHATPRTITTGDAALYTALTGTRFALQSSDVFARRVGLRRAPVDNLLAFHIAFGKTVPDISLNAVANLGYAECRFLAPIYPEDTIAVASDVIGLKQNRDGRNGIVYVRSKAVNQHREPVLSWVRWVMVEKRDPDSPAPEPLVPDLADAVVDLAIPDGLDARGWNDMQAGSADRWENYSAGERIDHLAGVTVENTEHGLAARLYQNNARVHFNAQRAHGTRFGQRVVYGGHIMSLARALSHNGLANACLIAAINGGTHANPVFAGDTIYAWTEVIAAHPLPARSDLGALRLCTRATKDLPCADFPKAGPRVVLDLDYTVLMPRRLEPR